MSRTTKEGKRSYRKVKCASRSPEQREALLARHTFGSTEKILRRNRKIWERLYAKIGRRLDKEAVIDGVSQVSNEET